VIGLMLLITLSYNQQWHIELWSGLKKNTTLLEHARPSPAYVLNQDKWLRFSIDNRSNVLTVISNASIAASEAPQPGTAWQYAIEYQILDAKGISLKQSTYHHRAGLRLFYDETKKESLTRAFFLDDNLVPTNSSIMRINTEGLANPTTLQLKLASRALPLNEVMVRLYQPDPIPPHKLPSAWQRLSEKQKEFLSRGNVYGPELLREQEKQFLLQNRSVPMGPQGVQGEDYQDRTLYFLRDYTDDLVVQEEQPVLPAGLFVDTWLRGTISIPEQGAHLQLEFTPINEDTSATTNHLYLKWTGHGTTAPKQYTMTINNETTLPGHDFDGGILDIQTTTAGVIRAYNITGNTRNELDITPFYLRNYLVDKQSPVSYSIDHTQNLATPFRIDIRAFTHPVTTLTTLRPNSLHYIISDQQENIIQQGQLTIDAPVSNYDRVSTDHHNWQLSDPARYYFLLPKNAHKIRFQSQQPALLAAYSRPPNLVRKLKIPEDYYAPHHNQQLRQPAWFRIQASENSILASNNRTMLLRVQHRPRETNEYIMTGQYLWENYEPNGSWLARHLLTPRSPETATRDSALNITFQALPTKEPVPIIFQPLPNRERITPSLLYVRDKHPDNHTTTSKTTAAVSESIEVLLDGKRIHQGKITSPRGTITLPGITPGQHNITINASDFTQFYINYATSDKPRYLKRLAHRLQAKGLSFMYQKTSDEEVVSAQLYLPYDLQQRTNIQVSIDPIKHRTIGPFRNWSFLQRSYDVRPNNEQQIPVLNTRDKFVGNSQRLFITLGNDLPAGEYRINVKPEQAIDAYILLYRLTPGQSRQRVFFSESLLNDHYAAE